MGRHDGGEGAGAHRPDRTDQCDAFIDAGESYLLLRLFSAALLGSVFLERVCAQDGFINVLLTVVFNPPELPVVMKQFSPWKNPLML